MEITWTYNFLESVAFIGGMVLGLYIVIRLAIFIYIWLMFRNG